MVAKVWDCLESVLHRLRQRLFYYNCGSISIMMSSAYVYGRMGHCYTEIQCEAMVMCGNHWMLRQTWPSHYRLISARGTEVLFVASHPAITINNPH